MQSDKQLLADGTYLLKRVGNKDSDILPLGEGEKIIKFNKEFLDKTDQEEKYLVISSTEFVEFRLKQKPEAVEQEDKRKKLMLNLSDETSEQFKQFTTKHLNQQVAIVVGGEALTKHVIRAVIENGLVQITRCTDNACEMLYYELEDNVE